MNLNKCVMLDKTVELELLREFKITRSKRISDRLFESYYPLVKQIAFNVYRRSPKSKVTLQDLMSDGSVGLMIAIDKFDVDKAQQLYPVAYLYIREYVHRGVMKNLCMTRDLSTNSKTRLLYHKFRRTVAQAGYERPLTDNQREILAEKLKVPLFDIEFFENVMDDHSDLTAISNLRYQDNEIETETSIDAAKLKRFIYNNVLPTLNEKEQQIVKRRILSDDRVEEVAQDFNQSKAAIYQSEKRLKDVIKNRFLNN